MFPIVPDENLVVRDGELSLVVADGVVHAPPEVAALLRRLGVHDASLVLSAFDEMPGAFLAAFGLPVEDLQRVRERLACSLEGVPQDASAPAFREPPRGAMPPR